MACSLEHRSCAWLRSRLRAREMISVFAAKLEPAGRPKASRVSAANAHQVERAFGWHDGRPCSGLDAAGPRAEELRDLETAGPREQHVFLWHHGTFSKRRMHYAMRCIGIAEHMHRATMVTPDGAAATRIWLCCLVSGRCIRAGLAHGDHESCSADRRAPEMVEFPHHLRAHSSPSRTRRPSTRSWRRDDA